MRRKGTGRSASGVGYQHRRLHFQEALAVQITANRADNSGTLHKSILYLLIHDQVNITLAVAHIRIRQSVVFFRQNLKTLGKKHYFGSVKGNLSGFCFKHRSFHAGQIADIHLFEGLIFLFPQAVPGDVALKISLQVLKIAERGFSHNPLGHNTSCNPDIFAFHLFKTILNLPAVSRHVIFRNLKGILSAILKFLKLFSSHLQKLIRVYRLFLLLLCQFSHSLIFKLISGFPAPYTESFPPVSLRLPHLPPCIR